MHHVHRLDLTLTDGAGALDRVVALCRGRRCQIVSLRFDAGDRHRPGKLSLAVTGDPRRARVLGERLAALVDVVGVE